MNLDQIDQVVLKEKLAIIAMQIAAYYAVLQGVGMDEYTVMGLSIAMQESLLKMEATMALMVEQGSNKVTE